MILKIAWRNIWRNPLRSLVVISALTIGMFAGLFSSTFINGWMQQRIRDGVETETSHIKVQSKAFIQSQDFENSFLNADSLAEVYRSVSNVNGVSPRLIIMSMAATAETATGVKVLGVDPDNEREVVNISEKLIEGNWFEDKKRNSIIIGHKLADKLKIGLRKKIILRFQDSSGTITGGSFRVGGIYKTINNSFDEMNVWVRETDLRRIALLPVGTAHEIAVHVEDGDLMASTVEQLHQKSDNLIVRDWRSFSPEFGYIDEMGNMYNYIFIIIILLALGFGIVNTMLMVVMERVHELGMLMAVGMHRISIFKMIVIETILLCITGGFTGILLGVGLTEYYAKYGVDLSVWSDGLQEWGFNPIVYPEYDMPMVITIAILVIITGILASFYPARKALKLNPSEAVRVI